MNTWFSSHFLLPPPPPTSSIVSSPSLMQQPPLSALTKSQGRRTGAKTKRASQTRSLHHFSGQSKDLPGQSFLGDLDLLTLNNCTIFWIYMDALFVCVKKIYIFLLLDDPQKVWLSPKIQIFCSMANVHCCDAWWCRIWSADMQNFVDMRDIIFFFADSLKISKLHNTMQFGDLFLSLRLINWNRKYSFDLMETKLTIKIKANIW